MAIRPRGEEEDRPLRPLDLAPRESDRAPAKTRSIIGMRVDAVSYFGAARQIAAWASRKESRYVCVASVNNAVQASRDPDFRRGMDEADLVTAHRMPPVG